MPYDLQAMPLAPLSEFVAAMRTSLTKATDWERPTIQARLNEAERVLQAKRGAPVLPSR